MLKRIMFSLVLMSPAMFAASSAFGDTYDIKHSPSNGSYAQPHYQGDPDGNFDNNWCIYPNFTPYTGQLGMRNRPCYRGY